MAPNPLDPTTTGPNTLTAFISGPLDADDTYFNTHYKPHIDTAISENHSFIIGPVAGIDTMSLHYLLSTSLARSKITIYMSHFEYLSPAWRKSYEEMGVNVRDVEDAVTTAERDEAMTRDSDYDILRYRSEAEAKEVYGLLWRPRVSNTEMNERRRKGIVSREYDLGGSVTGRAGDDGGGEDGGRKKKEKCLVL